MGMATTHVYPPSAAAREPVSIVRKYHDMDDADIIPNALRSESRAKIVADDGAVAGIYSGGDEAVDICQEARADFLDVHVVPAVVSRDGCGKILVVEFDVDDLGCHWIDSAHVIRVLQKACSVGI